MKSMEYFSFTKRERAGAITIIVLLILFAIAPKFFCQPKAAAINISPAQWQQLTAKKPDRTFQNDTGKRDITRRPPYKPFPARQYSGYEKSYRPKHVGKQFQKIIDINAGDTTAFIALPGIGSKLAQRIISFREKLGGFHTVNQLREIYGLKDSVFQLISPFLQCSAPAVRQLDINAATKEELRQHPYIRWEGANALDAYRRQHGSFVSLADLAKIASFDSLTLTKIIPYLIVK